MDYKAAGVDIEAGYESVNLIKEDVEKTMRPEVLGGLGGFSGAFLAKALKGMRDPVLLSGTDGVGTKLKLAFIMDKHNTIGIDCVAMCVNDIACVGGEPLFFLDYIACGKNRPMKIKDIVAGVAKGCEISGCALIGGETAEHPGMMSDDEYDIAGFTVGVVERDEMLTGSDIRDGDVLVGIASSGVHSNGFSLVRKVFADDLNLKGLSKARKELDGDSLGETLLTPTRIYVPLMKNLSGNGVRIKGASHITGGGFYENIPRMLPKGKSAYIRKGSFEIPPIFSLIQKKGKIEEHMMYNTFNMGLGMVLCVSPYEADRVVSVASLTGDEAFIIGEIREGESETPEAVLI